MRDKLDCRLAEYEDHPRDDQGSVRKFREGTCSVRRLQVMVVGREHRYYLPRRCELR